jgi:hypothetical protein
MRSASISQVLEQLAWIEENPMTVSLEDRVRDLEHFRFLALARMNALQTVAVSALTIAALDKPNPIGFAEDLAAAWRRGAKAMGSFPGADPAQLDALSQAFQEAVENVATHFLRTVRNEAAKIRGEGGI